MLINLKILQQHKVPVISNFIKIYLEMQFFLTLTQKKDIISN